MKCELCGKNYSRVNPNNRCCGCNYDIKEIREKIGFLDEVIRETKDAYTNQKFREIKELIISLQEYVDKLEEYKEDFDDGKWGY